MLWVICSLNIISSGYKSCFDRKGDPYLVIQRSDFHALDQGVPSCSVGFICWKWNNAYEISLYLTF